MSSRLGAVASRRWSLRRSSRCRAVLGRVSAGRSGSALGFFVGAADREPISTFTRRRVSVRALTFWCAEEGRFVVDVSRALGVLLLILGRSLLVLGCAVLFALRGLASETLTSALATEVELWRWLFDVRTGALCLLALLACFAVLLTCFTVLFTGEVAVLTVAPRSSGFFCSSACAI